MDPAALKTGAIAADNWTSMYDSARKTPAPPPWMPIIVATSGTKRLRRIEYRVVRVPEKHRPVVLSALQSETATK